MQVLEIGCGSSQLSEELYKDEITDITAIDLSPVAVEKMQKRLISKGYNGLPIDYDQILLIFSTPLLCYYLFSFMIACLVRPVISKMIWNC